MQLGTNVCASFPEPALRTLKHLGVAGMEQKSKSWAIREPAPMIVKLKRAQDGCYNVVQDFKKLKAPKFDWSKQFPEDLGKVRGD